jgi:hypothetical protein
MSDSDDQQLSTREEVNWSELKAHPLAERFPLMTDDELKELADDIKEHGLRELIVTLDGQILDGQNRHNASRFAGYYLGPENFREFDPKSDGDPVSFVISKNIQRRNLTTGQRSMIAAELYALLPQRSPGDRDLVEGHGGMSPQERLKLQHGDKNVISDPSAIAPGSRKEEPPPKDERLKNIADQTHVSVSSITKAGALINKAPELAKEVKEGKKTLNKAVTQAAADQLAGKPPKQKAPRGFSARVQKAIAKIGELCGENIAKALLDRTRKISGPNIVRWSEEPEPVMKRLVYYLIDNDWDFDEALRYDKEKAARELSPEEIKCKELLEQVTRLCCAQVLEAFERRESLEAKEDFATRLNEVLPPLLPYEPKTGVKVDLLTLDEKGTVTLPRGWTPEVEQACEKIGKECGASVAQALRDGTRRVSGRDIIRWSQLTPMTMKAMVYYVIDQGWSLDKALKYEQDRVSKTFLKN